MCSRDIKNIYILKEGRKKTPLTPFSSPSAGKGSSSGFTLDPSQLQGEMYHTALKKSSQGFGFTIIGGDRTDEFLQVKNVLSDGPAAHDDKMASGEGKKRNGLFHPPDVANIFLFR